jgi:hypothetical protein
MVKVAVNLPRSDWYSHGLEAFWAEPLGDDRYRLQNVPFYANGLAFEDIVIAHMIGGTLIMQEVLASGGHSTYRVYLASDVCMSDATFLNVWRPLEQIGATYEQANDRLLAIDIPPATDVYRAYELLQSGEDAGVWDFQEGHCGHAVNT